MDTKAFRSALGRFATGVCLISVDDTDSGAMAMTANSFASVSLEPPLVLWSIQNDSECFREYTQCQYFGISVLNEQQTELSNQYARKGQHGINEDDFIRDSQGTPLLRDALAHFSCRLHQLYEAGDHHIIIGQVEAFSVCEGAPLLFFAGGYNRLSQSDE